jgi:hypothetical protein
MRISAAIDHRYAVRYIDAFWLLMTRTSLCEAILGG